MERHSAWSSLFVGWIIIWTTRKGTVSQSFPSALAPSASAEPCPEPACTCLGNTVACSNITTIPQNLPSWTEELDLTGNSLRNISAAAFPALPRIRSLILKKNLLREFPADLWQLGRLEELNLRENRIGRILRDELVRFTSLRILNLAKNQLIKWPEFQPGDLPELQKLFLEGNKIRKMTSESFNHFRSLSVLKLARNRMRSVKSQDENPFKDLTSLTHLDLTRNRLYNLSGLTFNNLSELKVLKLSKNGLRFIEDGTFYGLASLTELHLRENKLESVTAGTLFGLNALEKLYLSNNEINNDNLDFRDAFQYTVYLRALDLSSNHLRVVPAQAFALTPFLEELYLSNNALSDVTNTSFAGLGQLAFLDLSENKLAGSLEDTVFAFSNLVNLEELNLAENKIKTISANVFDGLTKLRNLDISANPLTSLSPTAFQDLKQLTSLVINTSNLVCDCHIDWLLSFIRDKRLGEERTMKLICDHPQELAKRSLWSIPPGNLTCSGSPKPVMIEGPSAVTALEGGNASFVCLMQGSSNAPAQIHWKKGVKSLFKDLNQGLDIESEARNLENGMVEIRSELKIVNLKLSDHGDYKCIIENKFGSAYSTKAALKINVFPSFLKRPKNATVMEGENIKLECEGLGEPTPVLKWEKDGSEAIPAVEEGRLKMIPDDVVMFIVDAKKQDEGVYTCHLNSEAGSIKAPATITVIDSPASEKNKETQQFVKLGGSAFLDCLNGDTEPRDHFRWMFENNVLKLTGRHTLSSGNAHLYIDNFEQSDVGSYSCVLDNRTRRRIRLDIRNGPQKGKSGMTESGEGAKKEIDPVNGMEDDGSSWWSTFDPQSTPGIVIIVVVSAVVLTSLIWVLVIYCCKRRTKLARESKSYHPDSLHPTQPGAGTRVFMAQEDPQTQLGDAYSYSHPPDIISSQHQPEISHPVPYSPYGYPDARLTRSAPRPYLTVPSSHSTGRANSYRVPLSHSTSFDSSPPDGTLASNGSRKRRRVLRVTDNMLGNPENLKLLSKADPLQDERLQPSPPHPQQMIVRNTNTYPRSPLIFQDPVSHNEMTQVHSPIIMMLDDGNGPYVVEGLSTLLAHDSGPSREQTSSLDSGVAGDEADGLSYPIPRLSSSRQHLYPEQNFRHNGTSLDRPQRRGLNPNQGLPAVSLPSSHGDNAGETPSDRLNSSEESWPAETQRLRKPSRTPSPPLFPNSDNRLAFGNPVQLSTFGPSLSDSQYSS